jgi:hypothetical protein
MPPGDHATGGHGPRGGLRRLEYILNDILTIQYFWSISPATIRRLASPRICSLRTGGWRRRGIGAGRPSSSARIEATDRRIDGLVYELYGLTAEEIGIVEDAAR